MTTALDFEADHDGHALCDWLGCETQAWSAREMSIRPPGYTENVDAVIRLCRTHIKAISTICLACGGLGPLNCRGGCTYGWNAIPGAIVRVDWVKILEAQGESGLLRSDA